jgi:GST-like protein
MDGARPIEENAMIELYTHNTPNGHKISIALEELGLRYEVKRVNTFIGEQFAPEFVTLNPNAKIPVIVDTETGQTVYESNAILLYLAEKTARLLPTDPKGRFQAIQLLFFQAASVGPMFGQRAFFAYFAPEKVPFAAERYSKEAERLEAVMNRLLQDRDYFCGDYSIVDIAFFGWVNTAVASFFMLDAHPNLKGWYERVAARPAVKRGVTIPEPLIDFTPFKQNAA